MYTESTLMLYQQDLQLGPYLVNRQLAMDQGLPSFSINYFAR